MLITNNPFDTRPTVETVASGLRFLPSAPRVLAQLHTLLRAGDPTLQEVSSLLRLDPGLTARVLELGNRFSFARGEHCFNVEEAINAVGFDAIHAMISNVGEAQVLSRSLSLYGLDAEEFWRGSIACALSAETIAERTGDDTSLAYTIGLLNGAGMVAIDHAIARLEPSLVLAPRGFPSEYAGAERAVLGFTHAEVGAAMMRAWNFPVMMIEPVRWQHRPLASPGYARLACLLHAAKWLRVAVCTAGTAPMASMPPSIFLQPLRITSEMLSRMVREVRVKLGSVHAIVRFNAA